MEDKNIDAETLAALAGIAPITVERWLEGIYKPQYDNLCSIADVLDVPFEYLRCKEHKP